MNAQPGGSPLAIVRTSSSSEQPIPGIDPAQRCSWSWRGEKGDSLFHCKRSCARRGEKNNVKGKKASKRKAKKDLRRVPSGKRDRMVQEEGEQRDLSRERLTGIKKKEVGGEWWEEMYFGGLIPRERKSLEGSKMEKPGKKEKKKKAKKKKKKNRVLLGRSRQFRVKEHGEGKGKFREGGFWDAREGRGVTGESLQRRGVFLFRGDLSPRKKNQGGKLRGGGWEGGVVGGVFGETATF